MRALMIAASLAILTSAASAQEPEPDPPKQEPVRPPNPEPPKPAEPDPLKPDDTKSPAPDRASGIAIEENQGDGWRWLPRVLLFVPRWTLWTIGQPIKGLAYLYERYQIVDRIEGLFYNADQTYGIFPTGTYTTDFGLNLGLRFVHQDLFGKREYLRLRANFGNEFQYGYGLQLKSGNRFGKRMNAMLDAQYELRPNDRFFGIGNNSLTETPPMELIDPTLADIAVSSRFRQNWFRAIARYEARLVGSLWIRAASALAVREFSNFRDPTPDEPDDLDDPLLGIEKRFDTSKLPGYERGVKNVYTELQMVYDSRRQTSPWQSRVIDSSGWYAAAHFGRAEGIDGDPTAFWRYGFEVQRPIDLWRGSRVLTLRVYFDAIYGGDGRTDQTVSFIDLPRLGGTELLRGYPADRFRDRAVVLATAEYTWDLGNLLAAYTFVDAGRAYNKISEIRATSADIGFGGGVQAHTNKSFLLRLQLAASREGNIFVEAAFAPAFGRRERVGRQ